MPDTDRPVPELSGSRCLCRPCGRVFRNLAGFDGHRPHRDGCGDPATVGLVEQDGIWATPQGHAQREASARRLATVRTARSPQTQTDDRQETR